MMKKWSEYFNSYAGLLTFLGALLTVFGVGWAVYQQGYSSGKDVYQGRLEVSEKDVDEQKKRADDSDAQVTQLKVEAASRDGTGATPVDVSRDVKDPILSNPFVPPKATGGIRATLQAGNSARLFNGSLVVSLVGIQFGGDPLRYRATMNVLAGTKSKLMRDGDVGTQIVVGERRVTILTVTSTAVTFEVQN